MARVFKNISNSTFLNLEMKNEKLTRKEIIDNRLKQAGWNVTDRTQVIEEFDIIIDSNLVKEAKTPYAASHNQFCSITKSTPPMTRLVSASQTSRLLFRRKHLSIRAMCRAATALRAPMPGIARVLPAGGCPWFSIFRTRC